MLRTESTSSFSEIINIILSYPSTYPTYEYLYINASNIYIGPQIYTKYENTNYMYTCIHYICILFY